MKKNLYPRRILKIFEALLHKSFKQRKKAFKAVSKDEFGDEDPIPQKEENSNQLDERKTTLLEPYLFF